MLRQHKPERRTYRISVFNGSEGSAACVVFGNTSAMRAANLFIPFRTYLSGCFMVLLLLSRSVLFAIAIGASPARRRAVHSAWVPSCPCRYPPTTRELDRAID